RFHRVKGARGRTFESSGIGLALVQELVKLHGGVVCVESAVDQGSCFTVSIPRGTAHLPADRIGTARTVASTSVNSTTYVEEAMRWLLEDTLPAVTEVSQQMAVMARNRSGTTPPARILLVDDNADMRAYVQRLLAQHGYVVDAVVDGQAALQAAR